MEVEGVATRRMRQCPAAHDGGGEEVFAQSGWDRYDRCHSLDILLCLTIMSDGMGGAGCAGTLELGLAGDISETVGGRGQGVVRSCLPWVGASEWFFDLGHVSRDRLVKNWWGFQLE